MLLVLREALSSLDFKVEQGNRIEDRIKVPVLFGLDGQMEKSFHVDAFQEKTGTGFEIEAGRAVHNFGFLKYLFEVCMMYDVEFLIIAVRIQRSLVFYAKV